MDNNERNTLIQLVEQHFNTLSRGPYSTNKAKQAIPQGSIEELLLGQSELAWRAYFAAKKAAKSTHRRIGQAELARLLDVLENQPINEQSAFAQELALRMHSTISQFVEGNGHTSVRTGAKRRCTAQGPFSQSNEP
ncbi:hypothetical protein BU23DRAFT_143847 [Bimuria novae-zelandiae CBS 107.79]|uniref:Uncharacterized protein n=1 Tax=Bimuria novae-zelandiae CBS 107.79 TaxID=1447943 RepID=A0A6A5V5X0_9PLEO|nr:hypothetical protein BU23DRAFT_143847 [Bimuria novae-zelandiae CBS 107.79]